MRSLEKGQDKIKKICEKLRNGTLEPAKEEARDVVEKAEKKAEQIIGDAHRQAEQILKHAKDQIEQEKNVFRSSLQQAAKQTIETLKQEIEHKFFSEELKDLLEKPLSDPKIVAGFLNVLIDAIEKEGLSTDLSAVIPRHVSANDVYDLLIDGIRKKLKGKPIELGQFKGGAQVKLIGKKMTLDLSDQALRELLANFMRKDFRKLIFS